MGGYFQNEEIPDTLKQALDSLGGADAAVLPLEALGGCIKYLQSLKQDETVIRGADFKAYSISPSSHLVLDGTTLQNLEILSNTTDGGPRGSLLALLDQCCSSFGKRLFRSWLIRPLYDAAAINERLDAVEDLLNSPGLIESITAFLGKLPDLERSVARVRSRSCKLSEFMSCLRGFETAWDGFAANLTPDIQSTFSSPLLKKTCVLPDLEPALSAMHSYFDWDEAKDVASITPQRGLDPNLDEAIDTVQGLLDKLSAHLKEVKTIMKCQVDYKDIGKERYQIEIPVDAVQKKKDMPKEWVLMSQTKAVKRYHTPTIISLLKPLAEAQYTAEVLKKEILVELQKRFNEFGEKWDGAIHRMACLDALISLAKVSSRSGNMCRPIFVAKKSATSNIASQLNVSGDVISLKQSIHPCVVPLAGNDVIPNDIKVGDDAPLVLVLTGPNMGGKSTLLRQTCITVIMAQMGCFVPASNCILTPVDRIFTRLGARDDIVTGQSTFMVELQETGNMLNHATSSSLVILDELGRGTSTFDGYAIAYSVLAYIANTLKCRTMFSTHYHSLTEEVGRLPSVGVYHMDSIVDEEKKEVAFLYRLTKGDCPRSYGLHVANMASIPKSILDEAQNIADTLHSAILHKLAKRVCELVQDDEDNKFSEEEKYESLLNLWRAAKGRWLSWRDTK